MTFNMRWIFLVFALFALPVRAADLSLAGRWSVLLDRNNNGEANQWHTPAFWDSGKEAARVQLPGSIQSQRIGDMPSVDSPWTARIGMNLLRHPKYAPFQKEGEFKTPFWLTPERVYVGSAWYQREIEIPRDWADKRITLTLERPHWETTVWIDGIQVGPSQNALGAPHVYDLHDALVAGGTGRLRTGRAILVIRVDNRIKIPVGMDASAVTDQTQSNWNGIVGDIKLEATPRLFIDDVQAYPDLANRKARVQVRIVNREPGAAAGRGMLLIGATGRGPQAREEGFPDQSFPIAWDARGTSVEFDVPLGAQFKTWDEFSPAVYDLKVTLKPEDTPPQTPAGALHSRTIAFGLREISTRGTQLLLNGKPIFLRGTLECAIFPLTGYPPTGEAGRAYWTKIYTQMKAFGLNHLRFHSWCPPDIAFAVADEMGIYLQAEAGVWAAFGASGQAPQENRADDAGGQGGAALDRWIVPETDAMMRAYGNHPSFILMAAGNEPGSRTNQPNARFLAALVDQWKAKDTRRLYTAGSNWPNVPNAQFQVMSAPRLNAGNRINRQPSTTLTYSDVVSQWPVPVISHESGQWCVYPNFDEIPKYTGALKPGNLQIFQEFLNRSGMGEQARDFVMASGKFQALLYKEEIEALLRTAGIGGFQLLDLHDFPGQGTAPVGVLDAFWDEKPYITGAEYSRFCGPTVPLAVMPKRLYTSGETLSADILVSHFAAAALPPYGGRFGTRTFWRLLDATGEMLREGTIATPVIPAGALTKIGTLSIPLEGLPNPARLRLEVSLRNTIAMGLLTDGRHVPSDEVYINTWDLWLYPPASQVSIAPPPNVRIARAFDAETQKFLEEGGRVLFLPPLDRIAGDTRSSFSPIFWNRITFPNPTKEHTLSILCDPKHPALATFPTDAHTNWQWSDLLQQTRSKPMLLTGLPQNVKPLIQFIDDWDTARRLALAIEASYGDKGGRILICSIDLQSGLTGEGAETAPVVRPVARQLLSSLVHYMAGDGVLPGAEGPQLTAEEIRALLK